MVQHPLRLETLVGARGTRFQDGKAGRKNQKFPLGLLAAWNPSCSPSKRPGTQLQCRRAFLAHTTAAVDPNKETTRTGVYPQNLWSGVFLRLSSPARSDKIMQIKESHGVLLPATALAECAGSEWWGLVRKPRWMPQFNLIRSSVEPLAGMWRAPAQARLGFLSWFPQL